MSSVISMSIDDKGEFGGSDHNWVFLNLWDKFITMKRISNIPVRKERWNIRENQDWSSFVSQVCDLVSSVDTSSLNKLASSISASILKALHDKIGLKSRKTKKKPKLLPPDLVKEFKLQRNLEKNWKSLNSLHPNMNSNEVSTAESLFLGQKARELLVLHRQQSRSSIIKECQGGSS